VPNSAAHPPQQPTSAHPSMQQQQSNASAASTSASASAAPQIPQVAASAAPQVSPFALGGVPVAYQHLTPSSGSKRRVDERERERETDQEGRKAIKGLKHFSVRVCEEVKKHGVTSFNQVADTLVAMELQEGSQSSKDRPLEEKNIRRRVYDALNVLLALGVVRKANKYLVWQGISESPGDRSSVEIKKEALELQQAVNTKKAKLQELMQIDRLVDQLVAVNRNRDKAPGAQDRHAIPFIMAVAQREANISCDVAKEGHEVSVHCTHPMTLEDYRVVLKRLHHNCASFKQAVDHLAAQRQQEMAQVRMEQARILTMMPPQTPPHDGTTRKRPSTPQEKAAAAAAASPRPHIAGGLPFSPGAGRPLLRPPVMPPMMKPHSPMQQQQQQDDSTPAMAAFLAGGQHMFNIMVQQQQQQLGGAGEEAGGMAEGQPARHSPGMATSAAAAAAASPASGLSNRIPEAGTDQQAAQMSAGPPPVYQHHPFAAAAAAAYGGSTAAVSPTMHPYHYYALGMKQAIQQKAAMMQQGGPSQADGGPASPRTQHQQQQQEGDGGQEGHGGRE